MSSVISQANESSQETAALSKYRWIRYAELAGVGFLGPLIRLWYGEEPRRQLRALVEFVVIPAAAFAVFLLVWTTVAPHHRTKSGEVPTPAVVWNAAQSIWTFHQRETDKEQAYMLAGGERDAKLAAAQRRLAELEPFVTALQERITAVEVQHQAVIAQKLRPLLEDQRKVTEQLSGAADQRNAELQQLAQSLTPGDIAGKERYLALWRIQAQIADRHRQELKALEEEIAQVRNQKFPQLEENLAMQSKIAEEKQYLVSLVDQLTNANRSVKLDREVALLRDEQRRLVDAQPAELSTLAARVIQAERRIAAVTGSHYAKPWTMPMQIVRSVVCVFVGFVIGSAIAIPLGVLCGLSSVFMAAMTPFIALFKPVSPIVWLPIALIVVGGFIPDPDKHWLIVLLADLPIIGWLRINSAFMASAVTVALCSLWATLVNTALGVSQVEQDHLNVARVLRLGAWDWLWKIVLPSALPLMFTGLRISLGVGWMVLIAGELLSASEGIGKFVWDQFNNGASDSFAKMVVVVFVVGGIGFVLDRCMVIVQQLVSFDGGAQP